MASAPDLDVFARSLRGDRRARTELYRKFLYESSRVRRLGKGYPDINDFLQDSFENLLRTGQSWDKEQNLASWVESVALWTALENERKHDISDRGVKGEIRMCAELEVSNASHHEVLDRYSPPSTGAEDSPSSRILRLLSEPEKSAFHKRAIENGSWEEVAAATGKPLSAVGPIFTRAADRLARLFGAPPPMDDDLMPVFSRAAADPQKPEGRAASARRDNAFFSITPEMHRIGLGTSHEARTATLWDAAAGSVPPSDALHTHLEQCPYCTDFLRSLILMQQALRVRPGTPFHLCPASFLLANAPNGNREAFDQHLAQCNLCRADRTQALDGQAPRQVRTQSPQDGSGKKIVWIAAAVLVIGAASFAAYRYTAQKSAAASVTSTPLLSDQQTPTVSQDSRYLDLVENPSFDDQLLAAVKPENRGRAKLVIDQILFGAPGAGLEIARNLAAQTQDPGARMVLAMTLYRSGLMTDGYGEMLKAESMPPRDPYRCWIMFQYALVVADRKTIDREAEHLSHDAPYKDRVAKTMEKVRTRGESANTPPPTPPRAH